MTSRTAMLLMLLTAAILKITLLLLQRLRRATQVNIARLDALIIFAISAYCTTISR